MEGNPRGLCSITSRRSPECINSLPASLVLGARPLQKIENDGDITSHQRVEFVSSPPSRHARLSSKGFGRGDQEPRQETLIPQDGLRKEGFRPCRRVAGLVEVDCRMPADAVGPLEHVLNCAGDDLARVAKVSLCRATQGRDAAPRTADLRFCERMRARDAPRSSSRGGCVGRLGGVWGLFSCCLRSIPRRALTWSRHSAKSSPAWLKARNPSGAAAAEMVTDRLRSLGLWPGPGATTCRPTTSPPSARAMARRSEGDAIVRPSFPTSGLEGLGIVLRRLRLLWLCSGRKNCVNHDRPA